MDRIEIERKVTDLETAIEKANYIIEDMAEQFGITNITKPSEQDKALYAYSCGRLYNYIAIVKDYIAESRTTIQELRQQI